MPPPGRSAWWRRLPILVVAAVGIWLWEHSGRWFPVDRQWVWQLPERPSEVRQVEVQIWGGGELLKREVREYPNGMRTDLVQEVPLKQGIYEVHSLVRRADAGSPQGDVRSVVVDDAKTVTVPLR